MPETVSDLPLTDQRATPSDWTQRYDIVAAVSSCPLADCASLVIEYRAAGTIGSGHREDWGFTCSRCGTEFTVAEGELIFQSVPKQWLSANIQVAQPTMPSHEG
jgi:hypothetical protein